MIKHIVLFKISDEEKLQKAYDMLMDLPSKIDFIRDWEVAKAYTIGGKDYELCLISSFDSKEDLEKYDGHPAHVEVRNYVRAVREAGVSCNYEY